MSGVMVMAAEIPSDTQINIDRALNSPTLTIRYNGANAALVELRINGESIGTRSVNAAKAAGETNFTIDLQALRDGDNEVEIRLFDRTGKMVGSDKTNISTDQSDKGPVFLRTPKVGATVQGPVEISLGFGREMKDVYVSFFVDSNFKKMTNYPPYSFVWDSATETNGWHELEAWVIDESSTTFKTKKTRIFVNNPGGRTDRVGTSSAVQPKANPITGGVTGSDAGTKPLLAKNNALVAASTNAGKAPGISGSTSSNKVHATLAGGMSGIKPSHDPTVMATGVKSVTPMAAQPRIAMVQQTTVSAKVIQQTGVMATVKSVVAASNMVRITKGQHIPNLGTFAVVLNSQFVNFDVQPRVDEGVPMTPFRYLMEKAGGTVKWENDSKVVKSKADGKSIQIKIGQSKAMINDLSVSMERAAYLDRGRTIVPLSFLHDALNVDIEFDKETGHVLITTAKQ